MTFILNILHKDYSLLAADRKGHTDGPATVTFGNITLNMPDGGVINGVKKIRLNDNARFAIGIAGTIAAHTYLDDACKASEGQVALAAVNEFVHGQLAINQLEEILPGGPLMRNSTLVSFFDAATGAFFTSFHEFSRFTATTCIYARKENPSPQPFHAGSGSSNFEKAVGLDWINSFIVKLREGLTLEERLECLDTAFAKVSEIDAGCGSDYEAVLATRDEPSFRFVRTQSTSTILPSSSSGD
jgi:hypothetical protein